MDNAYAVPLWRRPTRADVNILAEQRDKANEDASASWECMDMGREVVALILGEDKESIAPMFIPEAIRSACYRAATGKLRDEVTPRDAASRRVMELEAQLSVAQQAAAWWEAEARDTLLCLTPWGTDTVQRVTSDVLARRQTTGRAESPPEPVTPPAGLGPRE